MKKKNACTFIKILGTIIVLIGCKKRKFTHDVTTEYLLCDPGLHLDQVLNLITNMIMMVNKPIMDLSLACIINTDLCMFSI